MRLFRSGPELPGEIRSAVAGKPLAAVQAQDGTWLVGTRGTFHAVPADGREPLTLPWQQVLRADWDAETSTLRVQRVEDYGRPVTTYSFVLREPDALLALVQERVTASVLLQRRVELERKRGFSVVARRSPTGRGEVTWVCEFDPGVDPADPAVTEAADVALREARESIGL